MSATPENGRTWQYLAPKPRSAYKQLFIKGRRMTARQLYGQYVSETSPMTPEEIAADWGLPLEAVLEAIAYCESNPPEIQEDWEMEERDVQDAIARGVIAKGPNAGAP